MQGMLLEGIDQAAAKGHRRPQASLDIRLQALLAEDLASNGARLGVLVSRGCGTVEVRVRGSAATLTLAFDAQEAHPAHVQPVVRAAVARYASSLGAAPLLTEREGSRC
jgi:hypothetical protein